jgi:hypothetical protein
MRADTSRTLEQLASQMVLGALLNEVRARWGDFDLVDHWQQGEFHHDTVLRLQSTTGDLPGDFIVVATNCNGGVKEVLCFSELPTHSALWKFRCPESEEFQGELPQILGRATTQHFFDPCDLLRADARSEYRAEYRQRQLGGGWKLKKAGSCGT